MAKISGLCLSWTIVRSYEYPKLLGQAWTSHQASAMPNSPSQFFTASQLCSFEALLSNPFADNSTQRTVQFWCQTWLSQLYYPAVCRDTLWLQKARTSSMECRKQKAHATAHGETFLSLFSFSTKCECVIPSCCQAYSLCVVCQGHWQVLAIIGFIPWSLCFFSAAPFCLVWLGLDLRFWSL